MGLARALAPEERSQMEAALAELMADGQSVTHAVPTEYTDADVHAVRAPRARAPRLNRAASATPRARAPRR